MSTRGRKPKPTAVHELAGNPGKRPRAGDEPRPGASRGRAPRGLGPEGGRFWRRYAPALAALGVLTEVDEPALQLAAEHYEVAVRAARQLREGSREGSEEEGLRTTAEGLLIEDRDGNVRKNPLLQVLRDHSGALRAYLTEFGMTPSSRSRLHTEPEEQLSLADILFAEVAARAQTQPTEDEG